MIGQAQRARFRVVLAVSLVVLLVVATVGVLAGSVGVDAATAWRIIGHRIFGPSVITPDWTRSQDLIIADTRLPRVLLAGCVGAGLALVGATIQAVVRNPLAGPGILGVSAGAAVGAVAVLRFGLGGRAVLLPIAAFLGALAAMVIVLLVARGRGPLDPVRLVLAGVAVSSVLSALTSLMVLTSPDQSLAGQVLQWTLGGFGAARWDTLALPVVGVALACLALMPLSRSLNVLLTGDESATALGVDVGRMRFGLIVLSTLLTGILVAVSGVVGFVGLMIPHIARILVGSDHRRMLPVALVVGAAFAIGADLVARTVMIPRELPVGIITALVGGPYFVWLLRRTSRR
ncbi:iron complex transport system permease protein [Rhodococcus sp. SMB37]|uniref:FecCD family ABC transporter permease n=1 Tax=Rhodococcus sp. SMB37 TaxID=2512213 RepID=UPI001044F162|nr:iron ABC transporter permease [Rhodococcus sp. SMB37]TCN54887.1 iron complex transport system permease protein [Rhodococcus sp. SMB37]